MDGVEVGAAERAAGFRAVLEAQAERLGPRPFLRLPDTALSFAEADELANRLANALAERCGVRAGELVMVRAENGAAIVAAWFACLKLGAVFMPVNPLLTGEPLARVAAHAGARVAICDAALHPALAAVREGLPALRHVVAARSPGGPPAGALGFEALVEAASPAPPPPLPPDPGAPAKLMYTSGTTGEPKGVLWSRACETVWGRAYGEELLPTAPGEGSYTCLPLSHVTSQGTLLAALGRGAVLTLDARFEPYRFWSRVRDASAVCFSFVGTILAVLARLERRADDLDNPVRRVLGAAAPAQRWREIEERFGLEIVETYGQTELASCWTAPAALPQRPGTVGRPGGGRFEARIVDVDSGAELGPGQVGELWVRPAEARLIFDGYLRADGGVEPALDGEGWYRTGDLLARDDDGELRFAGRLREAIRRRGEMIAASDIELAASAHPAVAEAAAVGVAAGDGLEEEIKLCVVLAAGAEATAAELHRFVAARLPRFMIPRYVELLAELPKTPSTRVRKHLLREAGTAGAWDARRRRRDAQRDHPV